MRSQLHTPSLPPRENVRCSDSKSVIAAARQTVSSRQHEHLVWTVHVPVTKSNFYVNLFPVRLH